MKSIFFDLITPTKPNLNATVNSFRKAHALCWVFLSISKQQARQTPTFLSGQT